MSRQTDRPALARRMRRLGAFVLIVSLTTACGGATSPTASPAVAVSPTNPPLPSIPRITPAPTIDYTSVRHFKVGEPVSLSKDGSTVIGIVTVTRVAQVSGFEDIGDPRNTPRSAQAAFMAVEITYKATGGSIDYNAESWSLVNGANNAVGPSFPPGGPKGMLQAGTLGPGASITGWLIYEVALSGLALLNPITVGRSQVDAPSFVIDLRGRADTVPTGTPVPAGSAP